MNILHKSFIVGMTVIGMGMASLPAQAQEAPRPQHAAGKFDPAQRGEAGKARLQKLHDALQLNRDQEAAWTTYLAAIKPQRPAAGTAPARVSFKDLTAPQRLEKSIEFQKKQLARQEQHLAALNTFYAALSPEQQKVFDLAGGKRPGPFHRRG